MATLKTSIKKSMYTENEIDINDLVKLSRRYLNNIATVYFDGLEYMIFEFNEDDREEFRDKVTGLNLIMYDIGYVLVCMESL